MAEKRQTYVETFGADANLHAPQILLGAASRQEKFVVSSYTLNKIEGEAESEDEPAVKYDFPGNISIEGYFYSPFYEVMLKELDDELQSISVKRINFEPGNPDVSVIESTVTFYNPEIGTFEDKAIRRITLVSPVAYDFIIGQPFSIYDALDEITYRGHLDGFSAVTNGCKIAITTEAEIDSVGLKGRAEGANGRSRYYISLLEENAPTYAEYIPATSKLVWRAPKKMSDLSSDSPIYNMPFTNGRLYIHRNLNVFVRRQDPHGEYLMFRPAQNNPLRRFQIAGDAKLDFDYIQQIIDSMVDAC